MIRGFRHGGERRDAADIRILTEDAIQEIHLGTLEVLEQTGVWVELDEAIDIFSDGRCPVDRETHTVRIPPWLVEEAIAATPPTGMQYARDPKRDMVMGGGRTSITNFSVAVQMNDVETGERRPAVLSDCADIAKIIDACDYTDSIMVPLAASDVTPGLMMSRAYATCVANTTKPVLATYEHLFEFQTMTKVAKAVAGGEEAFARRPSMVSVISPVAPMRLPAHGCSCIIWGSRQGFPAGCVSMPMAGGTAPPSIAAALVIQNAEQLSSKVLQHLVRPGLPFVYGSSGTAMDLQWGTCPVGSPEATLLNAGTAQIAKYYGMISIAGGL
jgi:trimethylamine---corrinoid protein Co-methyltransferase